MRSHSARFVLLAMTALCAGALAGCGVRGALQPAPGTADASASAPATVPPATPGQARVAGPGGNPVDVGANTAPVMDAPAAQKSSPLDWLIN